MEIKFRDLIEKRNILLKILEKEENLYPEQMTKLKYSILKWDKIVSKIITEHQKQYLEKFESLKEDIQIKYAKEKDGIVVKNNGEYVYSKEDLISMNKEIRELKSKIEDEMMNKIIIFEPYLVNKENINLDEFLTEELQNIFIIC